jgi:hypothetical protein
MNTPDIEFTVVDHAKIHHLAPIDDNDWIHLQPSCWAPYSRS